MGSLQDLINRKENSGTSLRPQNTKKGFNSLFNNEISEVDPKIITRIKEAVPIEEKPILKTSPILQSEDHFENNSHTLRATSHLQEASQTKASSKLKEAVNFEVGIRLNDYLSLKRKSFFDLTKGQYKLLEFIFNICSDGHNGSFISKSDFLKVGFNNGRLNNELKGLKEMGLINYELKINPENKQATNFYNLV